MRKVYKYKINMVTSTFKTFYLKFIKIYPLMNLNSKNQNILIILKTNLFIILPTINVYLLFSVYLYLFPAVQQRLLITSQMY
jgi:hypothetical protein